MEYSTAAFVDKIQSVRVAVAPRTEVMVCPPTRCTCPRCSWSTPRSATTTTAAPPRCTRCTWLRCGAKERYFSLTLDGRSTASIAYDASAEVVGVYLMEMSNLITAKGSAPLRGSFRLTFRGATALNSSYNDMMATIASALEDLNTIQSDGCWSQTRRARLKRRTYAAQAYVLTVTFVGDGVGGNVETLTVLPGGIKLTRSNVTLSV